MQPVLIVEAEVAAQGLAQRRVLIEAHFVEAFEFEGVEEDVRQRFMKRFDLTMQRGGG